MKRAFSGFSLLILGLTLSSCGGGSSSVSTCPNVCPYTVGGTVTGLATGNSVVLLNNGGDATTVSANTTFTFGTALEPSTQYSVTVGTQPAGQTCTVTDGSGTQLDTGNVTNVSVTCAAAKFLYASAYGGPNFTPGYIYGFAVDPSGALTQVPGQPASTGQGWGGPPMAITRDSKLLYTIDVLGTDSSDGLLAFQIKADGSLTNAPVPFYSMPDTPWGVVAHPNADFLYVSGYSGVLTVLAIDSATGALSPASSVSLGNEFIRNSAVITPDGQYLYQDDVYPDDVYPTTWQITGFSTDATTGALSSVPGSPLSPSTHASSSATMMAIDPTGKFLYVGYKFWVADVGGDGGVAAYSIDAASGALTAVPGSPFDVGGVPGSLAVDASGRFLIVIIGARLGGQAQNCLAVLSIDPGTGGLTSVRGSPFGLVQSCESVAADPTGPYVYTGSASVSLNTSGTVSMLSIDQATGELALIGKRTVPGTLAGGGVSFIALTH